MNKAHVGFYTWPDKPIVYAPSSQQPSLDREEKVMMIMMMISYMIVILTMMLT